MTDHPQRRTFMQLQHRIAEWKYRLNASIGNFGVRLVRWSQRNSTYLHHARDEWAITFPPTGDVDADRMQALIGRNVVEMVAMFGIQGHSGFSASYTQCYIEKALRFEPFSPLTGAESEWGPPLDYGNGSTGQQNRRCSHVFRDGEGRAYDINGKIFEDPDGARYTNKDSRVYISFPYSPTTEVVKVDENGVAA